MGRKTTYKAGEALETLLGEQKADLGSLDLGCLQTLSQTLTPLRAKEHDKSTKGAVIFPWELNDFD